MLIRGVLLVCVVVNLLAGCNKKEPQCYHCAVCGEDLCEYMNAIRDFKCFVESQGKKFDMVLNCLPFTDEAKIRDKWLKENRDRYKYTRGYFLDSPQIYWEFGRAYMLCAEHMKSTYEWHQRNAATEENELKCQVCGRPISVDVRNNRHASLELTPGHWYPCCSSCSSGLGK